MCNLDNLSTLVQRWKDVEGIKPQNDQKFIDAFSKCLIEADCEDFTFDGDGAYFGKQVTWEVDSQYRGSRDPHLNFEIAYSDKEIRVYDGRNNGFWVCEYISMNKDHLSFNCLKETLFQKLQEVFGIS